jgi:16S rRNA (adenine(1408)-N(1))-methyltransferase
MEIIRGKQTSFFDIWTLSDYESVHIDIGTGDGRFVQHVAQAYPNRFVIGIDACRENLHEISRRAPSNSLFVIANAQTLPFELYGSASHITVNFPWGSLLEGLLDSESSILTGLKSLSCRNTALEVRLNGGALSEAGWSLHEGAEQVRRTLMMNGFSVRRPVAMTPHELRSFPTTWAKRLAFGRDPRAIYLHNS